MAFQLKLLQDSDHAFIKGIYQDPEIMRYIGPLLSDKQVACMVGTMTIEMADNKAVYQVIITTDNQQYAGLVSMHWHADSHCIISGMMVLPVFQNHGVCKWAQFKAMELIKHQFPVQVCTVYIRADNVAASTSYKNMGFVTVPNTSKQKKYLNLIRWDFNMELLNQ